MSAGLPGLGLGGLFFIFSALLAPFIEIGRIALGRRREVDWPGVWRQFALALAMIAAVDLTLRGIYAFSLLLGLGDTPRIDVITVIPLIPVAITACLLAAVLLTAKAVDLASPVLRSLPPMSAAIPSRARVLAGTGVVGAIWFALLFAGANDLTRLPGRDGGFENVPSGPARADAGDAGDTIAMAGAGTGADGAETAEAAAGAPATEETSGAPGAEDSSGSSESELGAGSAAPPGTQAVPADAVEPAGPPSSSGAPDAAGAPEATNLPEAAEPSPPVDAGAPEESGPPAAAGPPEHANAAPHAGPS